MSEPVVICPHCGQAFSMPTSRSLANKPQIPLQEVEPMNVTAHCAKLIRRYVAIVEKYENGYETSGYSPKEFELVRTKAHNAMLEQLRAEGIDIGKDRAKTTDWAINFDRWIQED